MIEKSIEYQPNHSDSLMTQKEFTHSKYKMVVFSFIKRTLDILLSVFGLLISAPIILVFAILIKLETSGPAFYIQDRVGRNGKHFKMIKLRSMRSDHGGILWTSKNDPRITLVGRFIRKRRIDEIPQFINVLKGDMSIIGPRPETPTFTKKFLKEVPNFTDRLQVKPGITGWAQVNGGYELTAKEKLSLDLHYINNRKLYFEFKIFYKTIFIIFSGIGSR
ncbi:sugar transferase [Chengkuizengella axinellae]|uniref:Sugar transferase n=1 Tax=Chengkuizengella axinellae TaxID=3064388 RepID=A0ABT9J143_9BACL|nr:sugar transferase [Chengkuizengella sp. 2205SS18-9]MDP5274724.1 sugar transferase [Chengkuizengella sp. 2205SS18-9]